MNKFSNKLCDNCKNLYEFDNTLELYLGLKIALKYITIAFLCAIGGVSFAKLLYASLHIRPTSWFDQYIFYDVQSFVYFMIVVFIFFQLENYWSKVFDTAIKQKYHRIDQVKLNEFCDQCRPLILHERYVTYLLLGFVGSAMLFVAMIMSTSDPYVFAFWFFCLLIGRRFYYRALAKIQKQSVIIDKLKIPVQGV